VRRPGKRIIGGGSDKTGLHRIVPDVRGDIVNVVLALTSKYRESVVSVGRDEVPKDALVLERRQAW
jgi:hypothetical protein